MPRPLIMAGVAAAVLVALGVALPSGALLSRTPQGYFGAQTEAYLSGQLHFRNGPDPRLLALPNPYETRDPALYVRDLSLYEGKYYLYHGFAPILTVFAPVRLLTGLYATETLACVLFAMLGAALSVALLQNVRRALGDTVPSLLFGTAVAMSVAGNGVVVWLAEPGTYQLAQISAWCWLVTMLWAGHRAISSATPVRWAVLASVAWGLAVASRPTTILAGTALIPFALIARPASGSAWARSIAAWLAPAAIIGIALAWLNYARFDSPVEFGMRFGIAGQGDTREFPFFGIRYAGRNLVDVLTTLPALSSRFPFLVAGWREPVGLLFMPFLFAAAFLWRRTTPSDVRAVQRAALIVGLTNAAFVMLFAYAWSRYTIDFIAPLTLCASIGWMTLAQGAAPAARQRVSLLALAAAAVSVIALWAVFFETLPHAP